MIYTKPVSKHRCVENDAGFCSTCIGWELDPANHVDTKIQGALKVFAGLLMVLVIAWCAFSMTVMPL